jgi:NADH-quinone oxidoreductase subunit G
VSPERREVTIVVDGREIPAVEGEMLHDAARRGDVEIPVFCYEPKLGDPVGACRMCLVEIEGIPKLQTSCSTPVRDGMVVHTRNEQVKEAQNGVVEFLLVNHPLDCPVCDKGGECPLQDIAMGWGPGRSRVTDPKRHFEKPIPLSPLVALDRERCILCYRCVRFSQEVSEDAQLQLLERGDRTYVGTFDERSYVAPFHGNITDLCPVGALTSYTYRFRARPWDIEQAGSVCTLCPSQCNVSFTVRDEQVKRVVARQNPEVDDGWLCDRGRYGFAMFGAEERIDGPRLKGGAATGWETAIAAAAEGLRAAGAASAAIAGDASNEEGHLLQRLLREALGSPHVDSRPSFGAPGHVLIDLHQPALSARVNDIDGADAVLVLGTDPLHESPILDLRIRKAMRRDGTKLVVATERPTSLDGGAEEAVRYLPTGSVLPDLTKALAGERSGQSSGVPAESVEAIANLLRAAEKVVVLWGESAVWGDLGEGLLSLAELLDLEREGSGLLEVPALANARGLREVGCLPDAGPGLSPLQPRKGEHHVRNGCQTTAIPKAVAAGEIKSLILFGVDPIRDFAGTEAWRQALTGVEHLVVFSTLENETTALADVVFPLETHAEKDGTVTHPDGRLQRVRPSAARPGAVRAGWSVLTELCAALGHDTGVDSQLAALAALADAVPFYAGIDDAEIGGRGVRWQERPAASTFPEATEWIAASAEGEFETGEGTVTWSEFETEEGTTRIEVGPAETVSTGSETRGGDLPVATRRDLWAGPITELSPPLRFLAPRQRLEISLEDAERLGLKTGDEVDVSQNGTSLRARVAVRERMYGGVAFMLAGTTTDNANALVDPIFGPTLVDVKKVGER